MTKKHWDDKQLKSMLGKLPQIRDERKPDDIYMQIQNRTEARKKVPWKVIAASAAAVLSLAIITPAFLGEQDSGALNESALSGDHAVQHKSEEQVDVQENEEGSNSNTLAEDNAGKTADKQSAPEEQDKKMAAAGEGIGEANTIGETADLLFREELEGKSFFTIAAPTSDGQYYIPLTFLVQKATPEALLETLIDKMGSLQEAGYGLSDFLPLDAELRLQPDRMGVEVELPPEHPYNGRERQLIAVLEETFRYSEIDSFTVSIDGRTGIEFGNYLLSEPFIVERHPKRAIFLFKPDSSSGETVMAPSASSYDSIAEAIDAMKRGENFEGIHPSIPEGLGVDSVEANGEALSVRLTGDDLAGSDDNIQAVMAILLAARDFGFETVTFRNESVGQIGEYEMNTPLETPVAPNLIMDDMP